MVVEKILIDLQNLFSTLKVFVEKTHFTIFKFIVCI